ncbi:MAG TPA: ABC transporter permease [Candidatus Acidoferrales bacterium]|nr:ABC transporter permease [Candidatus Acidoferrales bacterium]
MNSRIQFALRNLFHRARIERDLDAEVLSYRSMLEDDHMASGMNRSEAHRSANLDLGGAEQVKESVREIRAGAWLESLWRDVRFGARTLRKTPAFTAIAALTLALGIGANTAIFSIVDSVLLKPFPYAGSDRIAVVRVKTAMFPSFNLGLSWIAFERVRNQANAFEQMAIFDTSKSTLNEPGHPERVNTATISEGFFEELGARPQLGRLFLPRDFAEPGGTLPTVLSDTFWRTHYGADPSIVNRTIQLEHKPYVVVGVAARDFHFYEKVDIWYPISLDAKEKENPTYFSYVLLGKVRRGDSLQHAQLQMETIASSMRNDFPVLRDGYTFIANTLAESRVGGDRKAYWLLLGAATCVLLIACANLASLLLARGWVRQREMALRAALGASHGRIMRQSLVESCLLGLIGGSLGIILAVAGVRIFRAVAPPGTPRLDEISVNATMFWFALALSLLSGILFGLAPARRAAKLDPNQTLNAAASGDLVGNSSVRQSRLSNALVVVEVALAFILMIGSALTTTSLSRILHTNSGMRTDHLLMFDLPNGQFLHVATTGNKEELDRAGQVQLENLRQMVAALKSTPGVEEVAASDHSLLGGSMMMYGGMQVDGAIQSAQTSKVSPHARSVTPGYFRMLGVSVLRGRDFGDSDVRHKQPVAIVNVAFAKHYWGAEDVLGKHISFSTKDNGKPDWADIVGVVPDTRDVNLSSAPDPEYYVCSYQVFTTERELLVRTSGDPASIAATVPKQIWSVDPEQPIGKITTVSENIRTDTADKRLRVILFGVFAAIGVIVALLGVYGVLAYSVARRTREIGIRMSLGAQPGNVLGLILRYGLLLAAGGVVIGVGGALAVSRLLASELYEIKPTDPSTYIVSVALMIFVALLACWIPARRAMRTDPMVTLRHQ